MSGQARSRGAVDGRPVRDALSDEHADEAAILRRASYLGYDLSGATAVIAVAAGATQRQAAAQSGDVHPAGCEAPTGGPGGRVRT